MIPQFKDRLYTSDAPTDPVCKRVREYLSMELQDKVALAPHVIIRQLISWIDSADKEAWGRKANLRCQVNSLKDSLDMLGPCLRELLDSQISAVLSALVKLEGKRNDTSLQESANLCLRRLQSHLKDDESVRASWQDLVIIAESDQPPTDTSVNLVQIFLSIEDLRGLDPENIRVQLIEYLSLGTKQLPPRNSLDGDEEKVRLKRAENIYMQSPISGRIIYWIGLGNIRIFDRFCSGPVTLIDCNWHMGNLGKGGQEFQYKPELELIHDFNPDFFKPTVKLAELSGVQALARVNLGYTPLRDSWKRGLSTLGLVLLSVISGTDIRLPAVVEGIELIDGTIRTIRGGPVERPRNIDAERWVGSNLSHILQESPSQIGLGAAWVHTPCARDYAHSLRKFQSASLRLHDPWRRDNEYFPEAYHENAIIQFEQAINDLSGHVDKQEFFNRLTALAGRVSYEQDGWQAIRLCIYGMRDPSIQETQSRLLSEFSKASRKDPWPIIAVRHLNELMNCCPPEMAYWIEPVLKALSDHELLRGLFLTRCFG